MVVLVMEDEPVHCYPIILCSYKYSKNNRKAGQIDQSLVFNKLLIDSSMNQYDYVISAS